MANQRRPNGGEPPRPKPKKKRRRRWLGYTILIMLGLLLGGLGAASAYVYNAYQTLPAYEEFDPSLTSEILDSQDKPIYKLAAEENRTLITDIETIPEHVRNAFIAVEDRRFKEHFGVDIYSLMRAVWTDIKYVVTGKGQFEGASTITMQLARNAFLTQDQHLKRKVQEMLIAIQLERRFTKNEILLRYLNEVPFGFHYGLEAASQHFFAKSAKDLTVSEAALLAGILKGPSQYDPYVNLEGAMNRRAIALDLMAEQGYISPKEAAELKTQTPELKQSEVSPTSVTFTGDWYVDHVLDVLTDPSKAEKYGLPTFTEKDLFSKGLKIYTALDTEMQKVAEEKLRTIVTDQAVNRYGAQEIPQGAVVIMDHTKGLVKAIVGGMEHKAMRGFNRATQALRQPGSAIKPLVAYLPAIDQLGWGPGTVVDDAPHSLVEDKLWPKNYEGYYLGLTPLRYALEQSINTVAVRALDAVGVKKAMQYPRDMGITTLIDRSQNPVHNDEHLPLALGGISQGITPLEMTAAYGVLGNMGQKVDPVIVTKIENKHGEVIFQAQPKKTQVVKKESVWLMVDIMKGSLTRGTSSASAQGYKWFPAAAGKTGTTEDWHDAWFIGFTPTLVTGVWTGYDNDEGRKPLPSKGWQKWTGAGPPTLIWRDIMNEIIKEKPADWERPPQITRVDICKTSGMLVSPLCPQTDLTSEWFRRGFEPTKVDDVWTMAKVVKETWTNPSTKKPEERYVLWDASCGGTPEEKLFIKRHAPYAKHPTDPFNPIYHPRDAVNELPTEKCKPGAVPPGQQPPGNGGGIIIIPPGNGGGTQPPPGDGGGTQPPGNGGGIIITPPPGDGGGTQPPPGNGGGGTFPPPIIFPPPPSGNR